MSLHTRIVAAKLPCDVRMATVPDIERLWLALFPSWEMPSVLSTNAAKAIAKCIRTDSCRQEPQLNTLALSRAFNLKPGSLGLTLIGRFDPSLLKSSANNYELLMLVFYLWYTEPCRDHPLLIGSPEVWAGHLAKKALCQEAIAHFWLLASRYASYTTKMFAYGGWIDVIDDGNTRYACGSLERLLHDQFVNNVGHQLQQTIRPDEYSRALFCF